jgi:ring-1,2-phenylacetyl-CoA epoxidase subunit PaaC
VESEVKTALQSWLLARGDDELILGQRDAEWCGLAPILEEDIAFANIALDELGHGALFYALLAELVDEDPRAYPDQLTFWREEEEFRNIQMVELPRGDWAFSMLRQFLFDSAELALLEALEGSLYTPLAEAAAKIRTEELYHERHTRLWVQRLGGGTEESRGRLQAALGALWPYTGQFFSPLPGEDLLVRENFIPPAHSLAPSWERRAIPLLQEIGLRLPPGPRLELERSQHTSHLKVLLEEMQSTARLEPGAEW